MCIEAYMCTGKQRQIRIHTEKEGEREKEKWEKLRV